MMSINGEARKAEIMAAFVAAHPLPSSNDVRSWSARYPAYADAFYARASELYEAAERNIVDPEPTEAEREGIWQRHLADVAAYHASISPNRFAELVAACNTTFTALAEKIGLDGRILNSLEAGQIVAPISGTVIEDFATALHTTIEAVAMALTNSSRRPRLGYAKADGQLGSGRITFREAVNGSAMSDERKAYWTER